MTPVEVDLPALQAHLLARAEARQQLLQQPVLNATPAELALITRLAQGLTLDQAARTTGVSRATAKRRLARVSHLAGTRTHPALVAAACRAGLLDDAHAGEVRCAVLPRHQALVLAGIAAGFSDPEIGARLFLSTDAVKSRCRILYRLLGASGRSNAVFLAYRSGLLPEVTR